MNETVRLAVLEVVESVGEYVEKQNEFAELMLSEPKDEFEENTHFVKLQEWGVNHDKIADRLHEALYQLDYVTAPRNEINSFNYER